jgi:hypothetical protein
MPDIAEPEVADDVEDGELKNIKGLKGRKDRRKQTLREMEAKIIAEEAKNAPLPTNDYELSQLMDRMDNAAQERLQQSEEGRQQNRRDLRRMAKARRDLDDCLRKLSKNAPAAAAYKSLRKTLESAIHNFFDDFHLVDVEEPRQACLASLPPKALSAETLEQTKINRKEADAARLAGEKAGLDETVTVEVVRRAREVEEVQLLELVKGTAANTDNIDLPMPSAADRQKVHDMNKMINGRE